MCTSAWQPELLCVLWLGSVDRQFRFLGDALPCPLACCPSAPAKRIPSIDRLTTESNPSNHVHRLQRASQQAARRGPVDRSRQAPAHRRQIIGQPTPIAYRHTQQ